MLRRINLPGGLLLALLMLALLVAEARAQAGHEHETRQREVVFASDEAKPKKSDTCH